MDQLHPSAEALIQRVLAAGKPFDWVAEFRAVAELDRLAREQDGPPARDLPALLDTAITVGNVSLKRLSWSGVEWYNDTALTWWRDNPRVREVALVWAHAYSRDPAAIREVLTGEGRARRRILAFGWSLTAPWEALQAAVDVLLPVGYKSERGEAGAARPRDSILASLVSHTGLDESYWLFSTSYDHVVDTLREIAEKSFADQARMAALLGVRLSEPDDAWSVQAFNRFRMASKKFVDRHGVDTSAKGRRNRKKAAQALETEAV